MSNAGPVGVRQYRFSCASLESIHETQSNPIHGIEVSQMTTPTLAAVPSVLSMLFRSCLVPNLSGLSSNGLSNTLDVSCFTALGRPAEAWRPLDLVYLPMFQSYARMIFTLARRRSPSITPLFIMVVVAWSRPPQGTSIRKWDESG
jgi:hypothetical protein